MKSWMGLFIVATLATAAGAQPGQPATPATPGSGSGSAAAPTAGSDVGSGSDVPSWLPGVQDATAQELATPGKLTLTMARAVEIAEKTHPTIRISRAAVEAAEGRVEGARVPLHPTLTLAGSVGTGSTQPFQCQNTMTGALMSCGGGFTDTVDTTSLGAAVKWELYDFGLTHANVKAAEASADAAVATVASTALDVRLNVESAYLQAVSARRLIIVAQATVKSEEGHLDQAKRFVQAQAKDPIEVAQAQATLANAKSAEATAESNEAVALANLRTAIGWLDPSRQPVVDPNWPTPEESDPGELGSLVEIARKHRPDIVALEKDIVAAQESVTAAHAERRPTLSAAAALTYAPGSVNWSAEPYWSAGLTLSWLAWDGGRSASDVHVANANEISAEAQRDALLVSLTSTIEQYRTQILADRVNVSASTEAVKTAQEELKLAEARYAQGLGSQIELADAETAVTTASGNLITAEFQLATAWANLKRALANS